MCKWRTVVSGGEYFTYGIHLTSKFQMLSLPMLHDVSVSNTGRGKFKPHLPSSENSTNQPHPDDATSGQVGGSRNDSRAVSGKYKPEVTTKIPFGSKFRAAVVFQGIRSDSDVIWHDYFRCEILNVLKLLNGKRLFVIHNSWVCIHMIPTPMHTISKAL